MNPWGLSPRERGNHPRRPIRDPQCGSIPARAGERRPRGSAHGRRWVYPRASGGTPGSGSWAAGTPGLSPRERGNRGWLRRSWGSLGSIPARAGEPLRRSLPAGAKCKGLSPRERGNHFGPPARAGEPGSIPARAGEPPVSASTASRRGVYPRASGGTVAPGGAWVVHTRSIPARAGEPSPRWPAAARVRVYPRASGGTLGRRSRRARSRGLSPRERGNRLLGRSRCRGRGSIPARAGEPSGASRSSSMARVYPRASGGTGMRRWNMRRQWGLSPRERGNRDEAVEHAAPMGSIPARAGEPFSIMLMAANFRVYPRASEGTTDCGMPMLDFPGLSPRERGNLHREGDDAGGLGSIPARAGEPLTRDTSCASMRVYPRASGGTGVDDPYRNPATGLSPRERGNPPPSPRRRHTTGLSPRERGNLTWQEQSKIELGSIPARAGEPSARRPISGITGVYPRASGGTYHASPGISKHQGLSPRERGNHHERIAGHERVRSIPARAGEPRSPSSPRGSSRVYPRASGGTGRRPSRYGVARGLSPRERGNHPPARAYHQRRRSIPARAGEPSSVATTLCHSGVYPRASGGTVVGGDHAVPLGGLSPRERGNLGVPAVRENALGSIPARAGEPATSSGCAG